MTTLRDGHFYPHYTQKETEAQWGALNQYFDRLSYSPGVW